MGVMLLSRADTTASESMPRRHEHIHDLEKRVRASEPRLRMTQHEAFEVWTALMHCRVVAINQ